MPFVFYSASTAGSQIAAVAPDQSVLGFELRDIVIPTPTAVDIGYTPNAPLNWTVPPPDDVAEALDELALTGRAGFASSTGIAGTSPITVDLPTTTVTPVKSGRFLLICCAGGINSAAVQVVFTPRADGANIPGGGDSRTTFQTGSYNLNWFGIVTLDRTVQHGLGGTISFGAVTVSVGYMRWMWYEL